MDRRFRNARISLLCFGLAALGLISIDSTLAYLLIGCSLLAGMAFMLMAILRVEE